MVTVNYFHKVVGCDKLKPCIASQPLKVVSLLFSPMASG